jgi:hypothetical protein
MSKIMRYQSYVGSCCAGAFLVAACGTEIDKPAEASHSNALVSPSLDQTRLPPQGPPLPDGYWPAGLGFDPIVGSVTSLDKLGQPVPTGDLTAWSNRVADPAITPPALAARLKDAVAFANTDLQINASGVKVPKTVAYEPEHGAWTPGNVIPPAVDEFRERGARLYCAAKTAYEQGPRATVLMGKKSAASFSILGLPVDIMAIQPSVALGAPQKFASGDADGAQAFSIPIKVGTKFTPLSILPFLNIDQEQYVYYTTADAESVHDVGGGQQVQMATHADAFTGFTGETTTKSFRTPLFKFAFGSIDLLLSYGGGQAACSQADTFGSCQMNALQPVRRLLASDAPGYPGRRRGGPTMAPTIDASGVTRWDGVLNDGPWGILNAGSSAFSLDPGIQLKPLNSAEAMYLRAAQNNDKSMEVYSAMELSGGLAANVGLSWGPFKLALELAATLDARLTTVHRIREQLNGIEQTHYDAGAEFPYETALPVTDLSITPDLSSELGMSMSLKLILGVKLPIGGSFTLEQKLFALTPFNIPLTSQDEHSSGWPDYNRARFSTAMSWDGSVTSNNMVSHWPRTAIFPAQSQSLSECLGAPAPARLPGGFPAPCGSPTTSAMSDGIPAAVCLAAPTLGPDDILGTACEARILQFAQAGNSHHQNFRNRDTVVRVIDDAALAELQQVLEQCDTEVTVDKIQQIFAPGLLAMCDGNGFAYDTMDVVKNTTAANQPVQEPDACL